MNHKTSAVIGLGTPSDGLDATEKALKNVIELESIRSLYAKLPTSRMKFVVAAHYELGYPQELIAEILGIKQPSLQDEIQHIRRVLSGKAYKPQRYKGTVKIEDLMKLVLLLKKP